MSMFFYKECPACHQGRLFIFKDTTNNRLYLHCEECEMGWLTPDDADKNVNNFLTLLADFEAVEATDDDLIRFKWNNYHFNKIAAI
ncbi:hypothetical protein [Serratia silvae]|uniref:Transcription factor zinc-finger domain-containing protein n=1 Tax=Serratia silvae TaxID=2824122 RepID=A0ABT0K9Z3_9GAMM|nr:hypothetical protein [Serratia silvae]MCL1028875.1 hypothetical protein [Serratia silvae]